MRGSAGLRLSGVLVPSAAMKTSMAQASQEQSYAGVGVFPALKVRWQKPKVVFSSRDLYNMGNFW